MGCAPHWEMWFLLVRGTLFFWVELPMLGGCVAWHRDFSAGAGGWVRCF